MEPKKNNVSKSGFKNAIKDIFNYYIVNVINRFIAANDKENKYLEEIKRKNELAKSNRDKDMYYNELNKNRKYENLKIVINNRIVVIKKDIEDDKKNDNNNIIDV